MLRSRHRLRRTRSLPARREGGEVGHQSRAHVAEEAVAARPRIGEHRAHDERHDARCTPVRSDDVVVGIRNDYWYPVRARLPLRADQATHADDSPVCPREVEVRVLEVRILLVLPFEVAAGLRRVMADQEGQEICYFLLEARI